MLKKCVKRWVVAFLLLTMISSCYLAIAEEALTSALVITYHPEDGDAQSFALILKEEENEKWLWLQIPEDVPLNMLELAYFPSSDAQIQVELPNTETPVPPEEIDLTMLDFSQSSEIPLPFTVTRSIEEGDDAPQLIWSGWLTISHDPRPEDLPDQPPEPESTAEPEPTDEPTQPPTDAPTEEPTAEPTPVESPTAAPTEPPTPVPTQPPTAAPTQTPVITPPPTQKPTAAPSQAPTAQPTTQPPIANQTGYGVVLSNAVNIREAPNGQILGRVGYGDVLYITGQQYDINGTVWHKVRVMDTGLNGFIHSGYARFMSAQEVEDYINRPTQAPTQRPTVRPTQTAQLVSGYARITWQSTPLRSGPYSTAEVLKTLVRNDVVYITGQAIDSTGTSWYSVRSDTVYGYVLISSATMMTSDEVAAYLASLRPTPKPSASATLNPDYAYAIVKMNNVNFRQTANGTTIKRVHNGTIARIISGPTTKDSYEWYEVLIDNEVGYLRADVIDMIEIRPTQTPAPKPTATPPPTLAPTPPPTLIPSPTPEAIEPAEPMNIIDRIRATIDTARYVEFARAQEGPISYAVSDFDGDRLVELLLVSHREEEDLHTLTLDAYKLIDGQVKHAATREISPVLESGTEMQVVIVEQDGRNILYVAQRDSILSKPLSGIPMVLTDAGWVDVELTEEVMNPTAVLLGTANLVGGYDLDDWSGLHLTEEEIEQGEQQRYGQDAIIRVFFMLMQSLSQGNG